MALAVVEVFLDPHEAAIAAGALRSAGIMAHVLDSEVCSTYWHLQQAVGGVRLCSPEEDLPDARAYLAEIKQASEPSSSPPDRMWPVRATAAGLLSVTGVGWLAVRRGRGFSREVWTGIALSFAILLAVLLLLNGLAAVLKSPAA